MSETKQKDTLSIIESGDANEFIICENGNWVGAIRVNGEFSHKKGEGVAKEFVAALNYFRAKPTKSELLQLIADKDQKNEDLEQTLVKVKYFLRQFLSDGVTSAETMEVYRAVMGLVHGVQLKEE